MDTAGEVMARLDRIEGMLGKLTARQTWLDVDGAAEYLGLGRSTVYAEVRNGGLPYHRPGGRGTLRFHVNDLDDWMARFRNCGGRRAAREPRTGA